MEVKELSSLDALNFLLKRTGRENTNTEHREAAEQLARELGYLPLALEQAAAYLVEESASFTAYLDAFRRHPLEILKLGHSLTGRYRNTVAKTRLHG
jgi:hypothetical protein